MCDRHAQVCGAGAAANALEDQLALAAPGLIVNRIEAHEAPLILDDRRHRNALGPAARR